MRKTRTQKAVSSFLAVILITVMVAPIVISSSASALPGLPSFTIIEGNVPYAVSEKITVRMQSDCSEWSHDVAGFMVWLKSITSAGQTVQYLFKKEWVDTETEFYDRLFVADFSFAFPDRGQYEFMACALDIYNISSGMSTLNFQVYESSDEKYTEHNDSSLILGLTPLQIILLIALAVVGSVAIIILTIIYKERQRPKNPY